MRACTRRCQHEVSEIGWVEIAPPDDLPPAFGSKLGWRWPQSDADWPRLLPKWPFNPVVLKGGPLPDEQEAFDETYAWPGTIDTMQAITAIEGAVVEQRSFWYQGGQPRKDRRPFAGFPHDWSAIRISTGLIAESMNTEFFGKCGKYLSAHLIAISSAVTASNRKWRRSEFFMRSNARLSASPHTQFELIG